MAQLYAVPASARVNDLVAITGDGFTPSTSVVVDLAEFGIKTTLTSDASGTVGITDPADRAVTTLTSTGVVANNETVTLDTRTYTFKTTLTGAANEVAIGGSAAQALINLKAAVNGEAGAGTAYGTATAVHATVGCRATDATHAFFYARTGGTAGNSLASTETMVNGAFTGGTFAGGAASTGVVLFTVQPPRAGVMHVSATDGTNAASLSVPVFAG